MKYLLLMISIISCAVAVTPREKAIVQDRWVNQEDRIKQLIWEAHNIAKTKPLKYMYGDDYVASFNPVEKTITTYFMDNEIKTKQSITLSYSDFLGIITETIEKQIQEIDKSK